jgi:2-oxoglutarate-Fe(II)-dependent dioxygenase family protein
VRVLRLKRTYPEWARQLIGEFPDKSHALEFVDETATIISPEGMTVGVFLRDVIPSRLHKRAFRSWRIVDSEVTNRATAMGTKSQPRSFSRLGVPSPRRGVNSIILQAVPNTRHGILGYKSLTEPRTKLTREHPEMLCDNDEMINLVDLLYAQNLPRDYTRQRETWDAVRGNHKLLRNTAFSTIYVAKNFRTAYHRDSGNMPGMFTALLPTGNFKGGELVFARLRVAVPLEPGDLLLFNPQEPHGNLPFDGRRVSAAFFLTGSADER